MVTKHCKYTVCYHQFFTAHLIFQKCIKNKSNISVLWLMQTSACIFE